PTLVTEPSLTNKIEKPTFLTPVTPKAIEPKWTPSPPLVKPVPPQTEVVMTPGSIPSLSLLNAPPPTTAKAFSEISFEELSHLVEQRLADFGVETKVVAVNPGPVVTRFELELAP